MGVSFQGGSVLAPLPSCRCSWGFLSTQIQRLCFVEFFKVFVVLSQASPINLHNSEKQSSLGIIISIFKRWTEALRDGITDSWSWMEAWSLGLLHCGPPPKPSCPYVTATHLNVLLFLTVQIVPWVPALCPQERCGLPPYPILVSCKIFIMWLMSFKVLKFE